MKVTKETISDSKVKLIIVADLAEIISLKDHVLTHFVDKVKLPGFREGKAPISMVEKNVDQQALQTEFLEEAVNHLYQAAAAEVKLRPVDRPVVNLKKFVPYTILEFDAEVSVLGKVVLPDYKAIKVEKTEVKITEKDVDNVVESLQKQLGEKKPVTRAAKNGDEVTLDFKGVDKDGKAINGADGKDYTLVLGSNSFIPGFEDEVIGLMPSELKTFTIKFPKDYGVKALASKDVTFTITVNQINEVIPPEVNDEFATKAGPFKTVKELKTDIKTQLKIERQNEADGNHEAELVKQITEQSKATVPQVLIDEQIERTLAELKQNLTYRGQTFPEYLAEEGKTEDELKKELEPGAKERVKAGLVLSEIAEQEKLTVTPEELEIRMQLLKGQYKDQPMQAELEKPEARRDIASRLLTEKTLDKLRSYS